MAACTGTQRDCIMIEQKGSAVRIRVRAQPRAARTEVSGAHGDELKIRIAAPPVDGAANAELVRFIAKQLGVAPSRVHVLRGDSGRSKVVEIDDANADDVRATLLGSE